MFCPDRPRCSSIRARPGYCLRNTNRAHRWLDLVQEEEWLERWRSTEAKQEREFVGRLEKNIGPAGIPYPQPPGIPEHAEPVRKSRGSRGGERRNSWSTSSRKPRSRVFGGSCFLMPFGSFLFPIPIQSCFPASEENVLLQLRESEQQLRESEQQLQESEAKVYAAKKDKEAATSETAAVQAQTLAFLILTTLSLTTQGRLRTANQTLRAKDIRKPHVRCANLTCKLCGKAGRCHQGAGGQHPHPAGKRRKLPGPSC